MNVLGDMSLVGPRPDVFDQRKFYKESDWVGVSVRPRGITGLAQATVRSSCHSHTTSLGSRFGYVENMQDYFLILRYWSHCSPGHSVKVVINVRHIRILQ